MTDSVSMVVLEGLDDAIIGTGAQYPGLEVLVYDGYKVFSILRKAGYNEEQAEEYLSSLQIETLGDLAPIFVFMDNEVVDDIKRQRRDSTRAVH